MNCEMQEKRIVVLTVFANCVGVVALFGSIHIFSQV